MKKVTMTKPLTSNFMMALPCYDCMEEEREEEEEEE
jgi:hypothetical protein